jgi:hypothetical protein
MGFLLCNSLLYFYGVLVLGQFASPAALTNSDRTKLRRFIIVSFLTFIEARSQWENKWILALLHFFAPIVIPVAIIGSILSIFL